VGGAPIRVDLRPDEGSSTPNKPCAYEATCELDGIPYSVRSRNGAVGALSRLPQPRRTPVRICREKICRWCRKRFRAREAWHRYCGIACQLAERRRRELDRAELVAGKGEFVRIHSDG
jgi:hypothetical protein